jgi:glycosyltransferase involved in cell wall biosynthesis
MQDLDVIHDHTIAGPLLRRWAPRTSAVTTLHGPFDRKLTPLYQAFRDVSVIAISRHQASTAVGVSVDRVIHHGIDVGDVPEGKGDGGYASFLGRMSPEKGPREAILIARAAGVPLRMAAKLREPAECDYFDAEVKPLLSSDIEYLGELGMEDKLALVGSSFAMLNPLQWAEPFGMVMIEALATGTPVVVTPLGSAPEIIDDGITGYLRSGRKALASALLDAAELDRAECRAAACRRFDSDIMVRKHVQLYTSVINSEGPSLRRGTARTAVQLSMSRPRVAAERPRSAGSPKGYG